MEIESNVETRQAVVQGLMEENEKEFLDNRINEAGPEESADTCKTLVVKPTHLAPKIDCRNLRDITLSAGAKLQYDVDIIGEPSPLSKWNIAHMPLWYSVSNVEINSTDYNSKLLILQCQRGDSGEYTISARNEHGVDIATVTVMVIGKPSPPEGPLQVTDLYEDWCKLMWKEPLDDGGLPIQYYEVDKLDVDTE